jgi:hypothetical protein
MKRLFLILGLLVGISQAQTTTTITGTIKDLSQALVTSGKVTFTLQPSRDTTISGLARFSPAQVVCLINASGLIKAQDGTSVCTLTMNTALNPPGTYYRVDVWPFNVKTSSFTFYAVLSTYDWSTVVPTPATSPFQNFVDVISNQTIGGNKIFTGQVSFQGALSLNCKLLGTVACVDVFNSQGWSGADLCAWIVSAQGALPATGGSLSIYLNGTNVTCAGTFNIGTTTQGVRAQIFGAGNIAVQNTVTVAQGSQLFGQNGGSGNVGTTPTVITAGGSFPVSTYLLQIGPASGTADGIHIRDIQFNCNNVSGCKGALVQNTQDLGDFYNVFFLNHLGNCMDFTASSQNLTIQNVVCLASASATSDNGFVLGVNADHIAFINSSATSQAASRSTGAAFVCNGCNASFTSIHVENHVDGILLNSTSPNNGVVVINEVDGLSNITNVVHIAAAFNGAVSIHGVRKFLGTNAVKNDVAAFAHVCTDEALAKYIMSANQGTTQLDTDCSTLSSLFKAGFTIADANYNDTDASAAAEIEYNSATYDALHMRDKGASPETVAIGPGTGGAGFGVRGTAGTVSAKQWILCTYASLFCQFPQGFSPTYAANRRSAESHANLGLG